MTDQNTALITVAIPVFNVESYLDQALCSLEAQTHADLQIICVNDGSTDGSLDIIRSHAECDARITVIDQPNAGYSAACNRALDAAHGDWFAIVEPDDWVLPDMYTSMLAFAEKLSSTAPDGAAVLPDIVKTPYWRIVQPDTPAEMRLNCNYHGRIHPKTQPFRIGDAPQLLRYHPSIWSALYRTDFLLENGIRFADIPGAAWADNLFLFETMCQAKRIAYLDKAFYCYREESAEKTAALQRNKPLLPYERWQQEADILERLRITDTRIWNVLDEIGFVYVEKTLQVHSADEGPIRDAIDAMFARMNADRVLANSRISPQMKRLFATFRKISATHTGGFGYALERLGDGLSYLMNTGLPYTIKKARTRR